LPIDYIILKYSSLPKHPRRISWHNQLKIAAIQKNTSFSLFSRSTVVCYHLSCETFEIMSSSNNNHNNNNNNDIYTAVSLEQTNDQSNAAEQLNTPLLCEKSSLNAATSMDLSELNSSFRLHGLVIGFLAQLINVAGTTYMYFRWEGPASNVETTTTPLESFLHGLIWVITQVDLYLYVAMWVSLTAVLTRTGMDYVRNNFFVGSEQYQKRPTKRSIFVLGVQFYAGVVSGVFFAWTGIDFLLGLPVPVMPMIGVLMFGLLISYTMVWCYDLEDEDDDDVDENESEEHAHYVAV
jgi:hypothetical protein